ncbi:MAG: hypothetical protein MRJ65_08235 [Candidatus Brocadiaceae bacterium]|nr:hypothetical protein [Candidatus Brocadiaceae bacterium]
MGHIPDRMVDFDSWIGNQQPVRGNKWYEHTGERSEIADFIKDNIQGFCAIFGDGHMSAIDDGTNSDYATGWRSRISYLHWKFIRDHQLYKGGPFSHGATTKGHHYGRIDISDDGNDFWKWFGGLGTLSRM